MLIKTWTIRHTTPIRRKASLMHKKPWEDVPYVNIGVTLVRTAPKLGHHELGAVSLLDLGRRCIGQESSYVMWWLLRSRTRNLQSWLSQSSNRAPPTCSRWNGTAHGRGRANSSCLLPLVLTQGHLVLIVIDVEGDVLHGSDLLCLLLWNRVLLAVAAQELLALPFPV